MSRTRLLLVDNYDSFTHNLAHLFGRFGADVRVVRNDDPFLERGALEGFRALCLGPGPGRPKAAGKTLDALEWAAHSRLPTLGVCLGHQAVGEFFGGEITHAPQLMHGKTSPIEHDGSGVFAGVPERFEATRYHSLCIEPASFPADLRITAKTDDGTIQGVAHRTLPIWGVQFHPESVLTLEGGRIFANFLLLATQ